MSRRKEAELPNGLRYEDLPAWMRKTRRETDWALAVVVLLCLIVVWPLLVRSGLPHNSAAQIELNRTIEMSESLQAGIIYPRWASDFNYGYGSPLWNYLAPLPHYLSGLHYYLVQSNPEISVKFVLVLSIVSSSVGAFIYARRRWGLYAGLLTAAAYLFSPQLALVRTYLQTDLAMVLALAAFVTVLWSLDRVQATGHGWDLAFGALAIAALLLAHMPLNLVMLGLVIGWLVVRRLASSNRPSHWGYALLSIGLGGALSAFYWLPAWGERNRVWWQPAADTPPEASRLLSLKEILAWPQRVDLSAVNPAQTAAVGVPVWTLMLAGVVAVVGWLWYQSPRDSRSVTRGEALQWRLVHLPRSIPEQQWEAFYFAGAAVVLTVLVTPAAQSVWARIAAWPPFYPRDVLPLIVLCAAMGVGQIGFVLEQSPRRKTAAGVVVGCSTLILLAALPVLYPPVWPESHLMPDLSTVLQDEMRGHVVASQMTGWLLPESVVEVPKPHPMLVASYESEIVDKVARDELPPAVLVDIIDHDPQSDRLIVDTGETMDLVLFTFFFAGWHAEVSGSPVEIKPMPDSGLITVEVPPGRHEVTVELGPTRVRSLAWGLSWLALLITGGIVVRLENAQRGKKTVVEETAAGEEGFSTALCSGCQYGVLVVTIVIFGVGAIWVRLRPNSFTTKSPPGVILSAEHALPRALQGGIDLLAYDIPRHEVKSGDRLDITLYWRAVRPDLPDYQVDIFLESEQNTQQRIVLAQHRHPGMIPSSQWPLWPLLSSYVRDEYSVPLDNDIEPGKYRVVVRVGSCDQLNLFPCEGVDPLFVRDERGTSLGQQIVIPDSVRVVAE